MYWSITNQTVHVNTLNCTKVFLFYMTDIFRFDLHLSDRGGCENYTVLTKIVLTKIVLTKLT